MQTLFIVAILALGFLITFQIAKASEYVAVLRGEEKARKQTNKVNGFLLLAFLIIGLIGDNWRRHFDHVNTLVKANPEIFFSVFRKG